MLRRISDVTDATGGARQDQASRGRATVRRSAHRLQAAQRSGPVPPRQLQAEQIVQAAGQIVKAAGQIVGLQCLSQEHEHDTVTYM